jgi:glycerol-3-phosphate cytidylyltransferase
LAVVYTGGTFDLFHAGHVRFLKQCKRIAGQDGKVVVALNRDSFIEDYKGKAPIVSFAERAEVLQACKFVDEVVPNYGNQDSKIAIDKVQPDFVVIGDDWARKDYYAQMQFSQAWLDQRNIGLIYVPYTEGISTTDLKARIAGKRLK